MLIPSQPIIHHLEDAESEDKAPFINVGWLGMMNGLDSWIMECNTLPWYENMYSTLLLMYMKYYMDEQKYNDIKFIYVAKLRNSQYV